MSKPNVVFILTDDQRFDTIHALGNKQIKTPVLDELCVSGMAFNCAHIPGGTSGAVCMPSRAMINSGKTLFHLYGAGEEIPESDVTMGQCFRENGYNTYGIGKWHNGTQSYTRSFSGGDNIFFGGMWDHWNVPVNSYHPDGKYEKIINYTMDFQHANHPMELIAERISAGVHSTELFTDSAINFIENSDDNPFMLYLAYLAPHDPRTMPKKFRDMYKDEDIELPENYMENHPFDIGINPKIGEDRDENLAAYPRTKQEVKRHIADYYAMISHIDYNIGRLIDSLKKAGKYENTIIVFTGDNGLAVGRHGLMGKQSLYDHSIRVPLIMAGPMIKKGITDEQVYLLDIYPTLCELCGIEIPSSVEGKSFKDVLTANGTARKEMYFAYTHLIRAVKKDNFKLIEYRFNQHITQLFDLKNDPNEIHDLSTDIKYAGKITELRELMLKQKAVWEDRSQNKYTDTFWNS